MKTSLKTALILVPALLALALNPAGVAFAQAAGILSVAPLASGSGDCSSWANACTLQTALGNAVSGDEIWVAAGTHKPTTGSNRTATFQLKDGVAVYGGFAGTETARDQRDPAANLTILSGDLNGNDVGFINNNENTYHVVTGASGATLDGFTVTAGNANTSSPNDRGGGLHNATGSPTLMNITFSGNWASYGGGVYSGAGSPTLTNITFRNNSTGAIDTFGKGGGMYNAISSNPVLTNVTFAGNQAKYGGGMFNDYNNSPRLTNVTFSNNSAYYGGGMYNDSNSSSQISNTIFWGNTAPNGAQIYNSNSTPSVSDSVVQNGYAGGTNILTTDPLLGVLANYGSFTQTLPLLPGSSAIDTGNDANCPASDQRGVSRPQGAQCDIGAFEAADTVVLDTRIDTHPGNPSYTAEPNFTFFGSSSIGSAVTFECALDGSTFAGCVSPQSYTGLINGFHTFAARAKDGAGNLDATPATYTWTITINEAVLYVTPSGTGDCSSWTNACTLQAALTGAIGGDEIWVAAGTYKPTTGTNRSASFQLKNGVAIYGGFAGTETARNQRDPAVNPTMLSGDLNGNDNGNVAYNEPTRADNSYHVVTGTTGATLDGVTITAGNANGTSPSHRGGGMYNDVSSPTLTNVIFSGNSANLGGGMFNAASSDPALTNVTFSDNSAQSGGGVYNNASNPTLTNATFSNNSAYFYGGGMYNYSNSNPTLTNVTLSNNSAYDKGGGMYNDTNSNPQISNTIFWGNTAPNRAQIYNYSSIPSISDSVVQGGYVGGTNILTTDPLLGTLGNYGSFTPTIPLLPGSSAIDTGNDVNCPASDQRGITRPQGTQCDIGAFEYADTVVLDTQIEIHPGNPSFTSQPSFTFSGSSSAGGAVTFECSLDGAAFAACVSPQNYTGLVDGPHTFTVRTTDLAGNQDATPASYAWTITNHVAMIRYATSSGTGDCSSWANACALQTALTGAISGDELWVAAGTYKPTLGSNRGISFQLKEGVALYGGFAGVETTRNQRDPAANVTILSGDIDNNDSQTPIITDIKTVTGNATNSYHVVTGASSATLDGFIITAGYANGTYPNNVGGGMHNSYSSPTLTNIVFIGNSAYYNGGGIRNSYGSNPRLTNVTFKSNLASHYGGGMDNNASSPVLLNVTFSDNRAYDNGGGIYNNDSAPILTNVTFNSNSADNNGGGMYNDSSNPTLMNVTFNGNSAYNGGGLYNFYYSTPTLTNTTFSNNKATYGSGGGLFNAFVSSPQIRNTILWGNRASSAAQIYNSGSIISISDSVVQGGYAGGVNILTTDPLLGMPGNYGGFTQTIPLLPGSSAIDTGNEALCPTSDQRGVSRPQGAYCDIGAFEYDAPIYTSIYFVKPIASGAGDCSSWANACTLQTALAGASKDNELWVAAGTYKPTTGSDRNVSFQLKDDVAIYGGFAGTETSRTQRNHQANVTILSGDIDNNDNQTPIITNLATVIGNTTNSYHVVTGASDATLEDFAITAGYANGAYPNNDGGGMYNYQSSPTLTNLTFSGNSATNGGGMFNENGSRPTLTSVNFSNNSADSNGGGMDNNNSNPVLIDVAFSYNAVGSDGGGMHNYFSSPILTNVTFSNNSADQGGGIHNYSSSPALMNVTFNGNSASQGGGMFNESGIESSSKPTLTNITFSDNSAIFDGGGIFNNSTSNFNAHNTIFWGNVASRGAQIFCYSSDGIPVINDSVVEGGCPAGSACTNIITTDPLLGTLGDYGGFTQTIPLLPGSSAIDAGDDATCAATDQRGVARPQGTACDVGAYEVGVYAVTFDGNGGGTPSPTSKSVTFGSAYGTLATVSRAGYTFNGWYTASTGGTMVTAATIVTTASDHSLYAQWTALTSPEKIAPADTAVGVSLNPTLSWNQLVGATSYEYCYSSVAGPCTQWHSVGTDTFVTLYDLAANYTYYWQVRAVDAGGTTEADGGTWWSFTTTTIPTCTWPSYTPPAAPTFGDVPMDVGHWSWVERLANSTITAGCGAGNYCPFNEVVRAQMAIFLLRGKHCGSSYTPPAVGDSTGFGDVPLSASYAPWVKQLAAEGVTAGCGGSNFCPLQVVNRAQMAIFLLRAKHGATYSPPAVGATTGFGDVPLDASYAAWVKQLAAEGVTAGCGGGNFCPLQNVNRAQMATFLVRAFGLP